MPRCRRPGSMPASWSRAPAAASSQVCGRPAEADVSGHAATRADLAEVCPPLRLPATPSSRPLAPAVAQLQACCKGDVLRTLQRQGVSKLGEFTAPSDVVFRAFKGRPLLTLGRRRAAPPACCGPAAQGAGGLAHARFCRDAAADHLQLPHCCLQHPQRRLRAHVARAAGRAPRAARPLGWGPPARAAAAGRRSGSCRKAALRTTWAAGRLGVLGVLVAPAPAATNPTAAADNLTLPSNTPRLDLRRGGGGVCGQRQGRGPAGRRRADPGGRAGAVWRAGVLVPGRA